MSSMEGLRAEVARLLEQVAELSRARDEAIRQRDDLLSAGAASWRPGTAAFEEWTI